MTSKLHWRFVTSDRAGDDHKSFAFSPLAQIGVVVAEENKAERSASQGFGVLDVAL